MAALKKLYSVESLVTSLFVQWVGRVKFALFSSVSVFFSLRILRLGFCVSSTLMHISSNSDDLLCHYHHIVLHVGLQLQLRLAFGTCSSDARFGRKLVSSSSNCQRVGRRFWWRGPGFARRPILFCFFYIFSDLAAFGQVSLLFCSFPLDSPVSSILTNSLKPSPTFLRSPISSIRFC